MIEIAQPYLDKLYQDPYSDTYYPAILKYDTLQYNCWVRFRGASARNLPKKSWKVKFDDDNNIFKTSKLNFNAEYRDYSIMRNHLTNALFHFMCSPASESEYIFLYVNNESKGVMLLVEELEENFLDRNNLKENSIYKARDHGANFAPLTHHYRYLYTWDKQVGNAGDYSDLLMLLNKVTYFSYQEFEQNITDIVDTENILNYFAIQFSIVSFDCFTKNYNLYINPETDRAKLFPWDSDGAFGNNWDGSFHPEFIKNIDGHRPDNQNWESLRFNMLFQRLMEYSYWRQQFQVKVNYLINEGFEYLQGHIDSVYAHIKHDVYMDDQKKGGNENFDNEIDRLKYFLSERKEFLTGKTLFERRHLSDFYCSNPFPGVNNRKIIFRVTIDEPQNIWVRYTKDFSNSLKSLQLYDDGQHNDFLACDLILGNSLILEENDTGIIPFTYFNPLKYYYPANGLSYVASNRTKTLALNLNNSAIDLAQSIEIGNIYIFQGDYFVEIKNISSKSIDLSYFHFKGKYDYFDVIVSEYTTIAPSGALIITSNSDVARVHFKNANICEQIYFDIAVGDSIKLLSPIYTEIVAVTCDQLTELDVEVEEIVLNEINYHSAYDFNTEDWVELYNPNSFYVDLSGWQLKDSKDDNIFNIPANTKIEADSFLVICKDKDAFNNFFPDVQNYVGGFDFGFSGNGELIRLYDSNHSLVDSLTYNDKYPWPTEPDGGGHTLELVNPFLDNSNTANWKTSETIGGTPGKKNSVFNSSTQISHKRITPVKFVLAQNFPNPFNLKTIINYELPARSAGGPITNYVELAVYNSLGQKVRTLVNKRQAAGSYTVKFNAVGLPSGIYMYKIIAGEFVDSKKMLIIK